MRCISLLKCTDPDDFMHQVHSLIKHYSSCKKWIKWYLQDPKASILFPACKNISDRNRRSWEELSDNSNGQEGIRGFLQSLRNRNKLELDEVCQLCVEFIQQYSNQFRFGKEGMPIKWRRTTGKPYILVLSFSLINHEQFVVSFA